MSDYPANVILDARGAPVGLYRDNQDPSEPDRLHPVPKKNSLGAPIIDASTGEPEVMMLPLDDPRVVAQLAEENLRVEGVVLVAVDEVGD